MVDRGDVFEVGEDLVVQGALGLEVGLDGGSKRSSKKRTSLAVIAEFAASTSFW